MTLQEILQKMINVEQEVYMLFKDLAQLEVQGLEKSDTYNQKLKQLQQTIEEEQFYFSPKVLDIEILLDISDFFEKEIEPEYFDNKLNKRVLELIYSRAYQLLQYAIDTQCLEDELTKIIPEDEEINIANVIKYVFPKNHKLYQQYYEQIFVKKAIEYSLNDRIYGLQEAIENEKDEYTKKYLQLKKYSIAFNDGALAENITEILPKGPLTTIMHEQIHQDSIMLKANISEFMKTIDEITYEEANDLIDYLLNIKHNPAEKKAIMVQLKAILPYLKQEDLEEMREYFDEKQQDKIIKIQIRDLLTEEIETRSYYNVAKTEIKPDVDLKLTDERIELIKKLIQIEHSIYQISEKLILLKIQEKENTDEFNTWLENLKDASEIEKKYLSTIKNDYEEILQFSLAINRGNLHLYSDKDLSKIEIQNIKNRINSYLEPLFNELLIEELYKNQKNQEQEIIEEKTNITLNKILNKIYDIEIFKHIFKEIKKYTKNEQKEVIEDLITAAFNNYYFTEILIDTKLEETKLPEITEDYLYIIAFELGIDYEKIEEDLNIFMYSIILNLREYIKIIEDEESCIYKQLLEAKIRFILPFLNENQLQMLGYNKPKVLAK